MVLINLILINIGTNDRLSYLKVLHLRLHIVGETCIYMINSHIFYHINQNE